jgi:hypothetical protein
MAIPNLEQILSAGVVTGATKQESAVGMAWLRVHGAQWDRVEFNVPMGPGITLWPGAPAYVQASAAASTKPRADIIAWRDNDQVAAVVECKGRIGGAAMGQVLTYAHMLAIDRPRLLQIYKYVAGVSILEGIQPVMEHNGVIVELYPLAALPTT